MTDVVAPLRERKLGGSARLDDGVIQAVLEGTADETVEPQVHDFITRVAAAAAKHSPREVVLDVRGLEFMNSRCLKGLVSWIAGVADASGSGRYPIRFRSDPSVFWQKRTLAALANFAPDLVTVE